ncbi:MAG: hypothetical protein KTR27_19850 [Leptolyngbyaceae cyanobacterium MAG.088]|nr:hypothetical protein [Leptolyngbyaceae cyanobacterium MAG.088]
MADTSIKTNPAFVFQTPQVRFSNQVTPLLVNNRPWDIAELHTDGRSQPLDIHLKKLFGTVLPPSAAQKYGLRLNCRYSFAVATVADEQLFSTVPVLLTPWLQVEKEAKIDERLVEAIAKEIERWQRINVPVKDQERYQFTL